MRTTVFLFLTKFDAGSGDWSGLIIITWVASLTGCVEQG